MNYKNFKYSIEDFLSPLTEEEEKNLFYSAKKGDFEARQKIIEHNLRLVVYILNNIKIENYRYDKNELFSVGCMGLIIAVDKYDIFKDIKFSTFASVCIRNEIYKYLSRNDKSVFTESIYKAVKNDRDDISDEFCLLHILYDDYDIEDDYIKKESYQEIHKIIKKLPIQEQELIIKYYGFFDTERCNQKELMKEFNLTQSSISRKLCIVRNKIKKELKDK